MKRFGFAMMLALGMVGLNACGGSGLESDCKDTCDDKDCYDGVAPTDAQVSECKSQCTSQVKDLEATGCDDEAEKLSDCQDSFDCSADNRNNNTDCDSQTTAFGECIQKYCTDHSGTTNQFCQSQ